MTGKKTDSDPKSDKSEGGAVALFGKAAGLPAGLAEEMGEFAGAGTSGKADDNIVPFLALFQDGSPEVKKRDAKYVEGAEPGHFFNKATRQLWKPGDSLILQPCAFQRAIVEWVPRDAGGGFVARNDFNPDVPVEEQMKALGGVQIPDPRDTSGRKLIWRKNGKDKNDLIDTRYHFCNIIQPDGRLEPIVIGLSSTGHTASRAWMSAMNQKKLPRPGTRELVTAPSWFGAYQVIAKEKQNTSGSWFVPSFDDVGWVNDAAVRGVGKELHLSVMSGALQAAAEEDTAGGAGADGAASSAGAPGDDRI